VMFTVRHAARSWPAGRVRIAGRARVCVSWRSLFSCPVFGRDASEPAPGRRARRGPKVPGPSAGRHYPRLAIGTGTDVAIEAADITLISGSLAGVVTAIALSKATMRNIRQNLFFAIAYKGIGIPVAAGVLYLFTGIRLSPVIAAAATALSSLSVVTNARRLRRWHPALPQAAGQTPGEPQVETPGDNSSATSRPAP